MYRDGTFDIMASSCAIFNCAQENARPKAKSNKSDVSRETSTKTDEAPEEKAPPKRENIERAMRRARSKVRQLALANQFRWFVTLTLDPGKINRYDPVEVVRKMSTWCDNRVRRKGLAYILVPEHHKDGAIHFHGFFNDALPAVDSGHKDKNGHTVYNLPDWTWGFTRAVELYGDYHAAVGYCCKYIGKGQGKIGGRWYYSGGDLQTPEEREIDLSIEQLREWLPEEFSGIPGGAWQNVTPAGIVVGINGLGRRNYDERYGEAGVVPEKRGALEDHVEGHRRSRASGTHGGYEVPSLDG